MSTGELAQSWPCFRILSDAQLEKIHIASLRIIERTGIAFESEEAVALLGDNGADVSDPQRVKIPAHVVESALLTAPRSFTLYSRDGEPAFVLGGRTGAHFGAIPNPREVLDPRTGLLRPCYVEDMAEHARLIDGLPNIAWSWNGTSSLVLPLADNEDLSGRVSLIQSLMNCSKPLAVESTTVDSLKEMLDICYVVAGSAAEFREKPFFMSSSEPVTPLIHGKEAIEKSLLCAERMVPNIVYGMPMAGTTTPATFEGCLAIANAELLSHLTAIQLKQPGAPVVLGAIPSIMDMRTMIYSYGAPELSLMVGALTELIHHYGLPMFGTAGCTDADSVGVQSSAEITYQVLVTMLTGADLVHDVGLTYHAMAASPELIVLTDEIVGMVRVLVNGVSSDEESLPIELIERLGPKANYLGEGHTFRHFRRFWTPRFFDRSFSKESQSASCESLLKEKTLTLMRSQQLRPLPTAMQEQLRSVESDLCSRMGLRSFPPRPE